MLHFSFSQLFGILKLDTTQDAPKKIVLEKVCYLYLFHNYIRYICIMTLLILWLIINYDIAEWETDFRLLLTLRCDR